MPRPLDPSRRAQHCPTKQLYLIFVGIVSFVQKQILFTVSEWNEAVVSRVWRECKTGLPDGFFSNQKYQFGQILDGLRWRHVDIF
jgi:hypothetical protein